MRERTSRSRVRKVIGRNIDGLYRRDGAILSGCNTLLQSTDICGQGRLIAYCRRHTAEQCRYLRTCLNETEDVINEQQYVLMLNITEVLSHRKTRQGNTHTCAWRLIHLPIDQRRLIDNARFSHLTPKVIALTSTLTDTSEYGVTAMLSCDVMDQFHDKYGLADACAAKKTSFTTTRIRSNQVNDLDTRFQDLSGCFLLIKMRSRTMNRPKLLVAHRCRVMINRLAEDIEYAAQALIADWYLDWRTSVNSLHAAGKTIRRAHSDTAGHAVAEVLHDFDNEVDVHFTSFALDGNCIQDFRQFACGKFNIYDRSNDLYDFTFCQW